MKMRKEHFDTVKKAMLDLEFKGKGMATWEKKYREELYLTAMRFRWDWFWQSTFSAAEYSKLLPELYGYLNDDHIDTALNKIVEDALKGDQ